MCANGGVRVFSRNGRQSRYPHFIRLGLKKQTGVKENRIRHWLEEILIDQIQSWFSIRPAPLSCPVCPAQLRPHQRTHPHWSDCWAPPVKIIAYYNYPAKYVNRVSTCILGIIYILYFHIQLQQFPWKIQALGKEPKVIEWGMLEAAWGSGVDLEMLKWDIFTKWNFSSPCHTLQTVLNLGQSGLSAE